MSRGEFRELFLSALEQAARSVEEHYHVKVPRNYLISFEGAGYPQSLIDMETALDRLYLGDDLYFRIIDVAVLEASSKTTKVYVRVSGHAPVAAIEETWNNPPGNGPFKQLLSLQFTMSPD